MTRIALLLIFFVLGISPVCWAQPDFQPPFDLRCENESNPLGIDIAAPLLSWKLKSNVANQWQQSYQIQVASDSVLLKNSNPDIWDSKRVMSGNSVGVSCNGLKPGSGKRYYWRVRVWDKAGQPSGYSRIAFWEMGLLSASDWKGRWISAPPVFNWPDFIEQRRNAGDDIRKETPMAAPLFRKGFYLDKKPAKARLYISGLGYNVPYMNGKRVGTRLLDPAFTRYDKRVLYTTHDVTHLLQKGNNALGVMLGNGWYNMVTRAVWGFDQAVWRDKPVLLAQLVMEYDDGSQQLISTDSTWKCAPGPVTFNSIMQGEVYDARREKKGWTVPTFNDAEWNTVNIVRGPEGKLVSQREPPVRVIAEIKPVKVTRLANGNYVFDIGQNIAGFARIKLNVPKGQQVIIKYGERLSKDGSVDQEESARHVMDRPFQTDKYIGDGSGEITWRPEFTYHGFQFVEVSGLTENPEADALTAIAISTDFSLAGNFSCSNELFNTIQRNAVWSYRNNFQGYPTDCPHREKNGWTGDAHLGAEMGLYNFNSGTGYNKWLHDISDEQRPGGELPGIVPTSGWGYHWGNGPTYDAALLLITWYQYVYNGDTRIIKEMYPYIKRYVEYLKHRSVNFIIDFGLGDWATSGTETPVPLMSTAFYYLHAALLSKMAGIIGNPTDSIQYKELANQIKSAFNEKFYNGKGMYGNGSQTAQATAIYMGLAEDKNLAAVLDTLVEKVKEKDDHLDAGIFGTKFLMYALAQNGEAALAYKIANQRTFPSWGNSIEHGATTLWERWDGSKSLNHIMYGDISAWFYKILAGINPDVTEPGFKRIIFSPHFVKDLQWVNASHESLYGIIKSSWKRINGAIIYNISVPANTSAEIRLPLTGKKSLKLNGRRLKEQDKLIQHITYGKKEIMITVGSGNYECSFNEII